MSNIDPCIVDNIIWGFYEEADAQNNAGSNSAGGSNNGSMSRDDAFWESAASYEPPYDEDLFDDDRPYERSSDYEEDDSDDDTFHPEQSSAFGEEEDLASSPYIKGYNEGYHEGFWGAVLDMVHFGDITFERAAEFLGADIEEVKQQLKARLEEFGMEEDEDEEEEPDLEGLEPLDNSTYQFN